MREHSPDSKFQRRNRSELMHPGTCMSCGSGNCEEGYIDLGTYYDYEGQMYLCQTCIVEAAEVAGCLSPDETKHLQGLTEASATENEQLKEDLTNANQRLGAYDAIFDTVRPSLVASIPASVETVTADPTLFDESGDADADVTGSADDGEPESEESVTIGSGLTRTSRAKRGNSGTRSSSGISI